jgi:malonyl-CoA O-methyltransferase
VSSPDSPIQSSGPIDIRRVRQLFSRPSQVAESAFLRREIAGRMHERLALVKIAPERVLDAGCGEGADLPTLQSTFAGAQLLGLDASCAMLRSAREKQVAALSSMRRLLNRWLAGNAEAGLGTSGTLMCGNFAQLPLAANSVDLVWSNLALHWHPQPDRVFEEWRRVLRVEGLLMFSCFGPDTFKEIRAAFSESDPAPHTLPFVDMHDLGDMLVHAGFATPVMDMETITVTYDSVEKLMADVRAWGGNPLSSRRRGLLGAGSWRKVVRAVEQNRRPDGKLPLTFEVVYGHAFRPASSKTASGESIVQWDLGRK